MSTTFKVEYTLATDHATSQPRFLTFDTKIEARAVEGALAAVLSDLSSLCVKEVACLGSKEFSPVELETFRFLCGTKPGRVQAIKLARFLAQSGLREASDFLHELCPRDEGPKPCGETSLGPAQPCALFPNTLPPHLLAARDRLITALCTDFTDSASADRHWAYDVAKDGHTGFANRTNQELVKATKDANLHEESSSIQDAINLLESAGAV